MMVAAFELHEVVKRFGSVTALAGVSLQAKEGTVLGLLGPNGSGKTTVVKMLSTLVTPDSGSAAVCGVDVLRNPGQVRKLIGLAGQFAAVDEFQTGYENVVMVGRLYGLGMAEARSRSVDLLARLGLQEAAGRQVRTYSGGMRRRLDLGASLIGRPRVLFLDEPTTGLDPATRNDLWQIIRDLVRQGTSVLLTTQYLEEADELADAITVVDRGRVVAQGTSEDLKARLGGDVITFRVQNDADEGAVRRLLSRAASGAVTFDSATRMFRVPVADGSQGLLDVVKALTGSGIAVASLSLQRPSLDDVFLALTGDTAQSETGQPTVAVAG
jgi:ABC-2 type transport system ATP-binding protein